ARLADGRDVARRARDHRVAGLLAGDLRVVVDLAVAARVDELTLGARVGLEDRLDLHGRGRARLLDLVVGPRAGVRRLGAPGVGQAEVLVDGDARVEDGVLGVVDDGAEVHAGGDERLRVGVDVEA